MQEEYIKELELEKKKLEAIIASKNMEIESLEKLKADVEARYENLKERYNNLLDEIADEQ